MKSGIILVDKPAGWTSFDVVAKLRSQIRANYQKQGIKPTKRQLKIGHAGTLDPFATGLLIILLGDECKNADKYLKLGKTYEFTAKLGATSTTGDTEGEVVAVSNARPSEKQVLEVLERFKGRISQTPPAYSAIKVGGQRAYKLAREGKAVAIEPRNVSVMKLDLVEYSYPDLKCICQVSSGTYIRSLVEDIGKVLKTGAYCNQLRRTKIDKYEIHDAVSVDDAVLSSDTLLD